MEIYPSESSYECTDFWLWLSILQTGALVRHSAVNLLKCWSLPGIALKIKYLKGSASTSKKERCEKTLGLGWLMTVRVKSGFSQRFGPKPAEPAGCADDTKQLLLLGAPQSALGQ